MRIPYKRGRPKTLHGHECALKYSLASDARKSEWTSGDRGMSVITANADCWGLSVQYHQAPTREINGVPVPEYMIPEAEGVKVQQGS